ncbi:MAG: hypothetical protein HW387_1740 [Parachlamydiales bacterium]|nr:hypothetical protein [Parachlamydiales bacterium]
MNHSRRVRQESGCTGSETGNIRLSGIYILLGEGSIREDNTQTENQSQDHENETQKSKRMGPTGQEPKAAQRNMENTQSEVKRTHTILWNLA